MEEVLLQEPHGQAAQDTVNEGASQLRSQNNCGDPALAGVTLLSTGVTATALAGTTLLSTGVATSRLPLQGSETSCDDPAPAGVPAQGRSRCWRLPHILMLGLLLALVLVVAIVIGLVISGGFSPSPASTPKCWDYITKAGPCNNTLLKCPSEKYVGKWSVYVVPCDNGQSQQIYDIDPGWGGAHITMTGYQTMSTSQAMSDFSKSVASMSFTSERGWHPHDFNVQQGGRLGVWRALDIYSDNLGNVADTLSKSGWDSTSSSFHVTLASMTNQSWQKGDPTYNHLTSWFHSIDWAVVLVQCYMKDGQMYFHHQKGLQLNELKTSLNSFQT